MFKFIAAVFLMTVGLNAGASVLFEPYGGYALGTISRTAATGGASDSGTIDGFDYGGRLGFMIQHFLIAAAEYQGISATEKMSTAATSEGWSQHTLYATLGFQAPRGFRLMGSYGWDFEATESNTPNATQYKGTAYKILMGYHLPAHVALNIEYAIHQANTETTSGTSSSVSSNYSKFNYSTVIASISFPFTFFHHLGGGDGESSGHGH
jgi:hypothetical protein